MKAQFCDNRYLRPKPGGHIQTMAFWNGHPLTGQNLKLQRSESGTRRRCRVCLKATKHRTYEKSKAARLVK